MNQTYNLITTVWSNSVTPKTWMSSFSQSDSTFCIWRNLKLTSYCTAFVSPKVSIEAFYEYLILARKNHTVYKL